MKKQKNYGLENDCIDRQVIIGKKGIDVFVIEKDKKAIGEITVSYKNDELET